MLAFSVYCSVCSAPKADKEVSGRSLFDAIQDTEAYVAANDDVILVVFRGTKELTDWATNLSIRTRNIPKAWGFGDEDCDVHKVRMYANTRWNARFRSVFITRKTPDCIAVSGVTGL